MIAWFSSHFVELLGVLFSLIYLFLSIRQNILLWPAGIMGAVCYMVVFYQSKFYADMGLNGYYFVISIYGWIHWSGGGRKRTDPLKISRVRMRPALVLLLVTTAAFLLIGLILKRYTDSPIPFWDAFTTALSFAATWMLARKILEHWILWIIVDTVSMALYLYRGLYPTLVLFAVYTAMAVIGYTKWKRSYLQAGPEGSL